MTAAPVLSPARPLGPRALRDDLLDDLRQAAPMPTAPPKPDIQVPVVTVPVVTASGRPAPRPTGRPVPARPETPTVELSVTPKFWWGFRMKTLGESPGVLIGAGPVRISLTGFRR